MKSLFPSKFFPNCVQISRWNPKPFKTISNSNTALKSAELYFPGRLYGHLTSNIEESLNSWLLEASEKPILAVFEQIRHQLMGWFNARRTLEDKTEGLLVAKSIQYLQTVTNNRTRRYCSVPSIPGVLYEVKSMETSRNYIVNLAEQSCTCLILRLSGYPSSHAISNHT